MTAEALPAASGVAKGLDEPDDEEDESEDEAEDGAEDEVEDAISGLSAFPLAPAAPVTNAVVVNGDSIATGRDALRPCVRSKLITNTTAASANPPIINRERPCESITEKNSSRSLPQSVDFSGWVFYTARQSMITHLYSCVLPV